MARLETISRKREREVFDTSSFSEHRIKRRIAALPHRISPFPSLVKDQETTSTGPENLNRTAPTALTPVDSDSEETFIPLQSTFSPWSSAANLLSQAITTSPRLYSSSLPTIDSDPAPEDMEMTDTFHLSPGPSPRGRIPTPIHSSLAPSFRNERGYRMNSFAEPIIPGRRPPSPISEGQPSPSVIPVVDSMGGMLMEVEDSAINIVLLERHRSSKKGHSRSKHSSRNAHETKDTSGRPEKKSFSMGYKRDCERCKRREPGHFTHVITH